MKYENSLKDRGLSIVYQESDFISSQARIFCSDFTTESLDLSIAGSEGKGLGMATMFDTRYGIRGLGIYFRCCSLR